MTQPPSSPVTAASSLADQLERCPVEYTKADVGYAVVPLRMRRAVVEALRRPAQRQPDREDLYDQNWKDADEFCRGAFGPFVVDVKQYTKIVAELMQHATDRALSSVTSTECRDMTPEERLAMERATAEVDFEAKAILAARLTSTKCDHPRKLGGGSVGGDGSWSSYWTCQDCGASESQGSAERPMVVGRTTGKLHEGDQVPGMPGAICHACGLGYKCFDPDCPNDKPDPAVTRPVAALERLSVDKLAKHFGVSVEQAQAAQDDIGFMYRELASTVTRPSVDGK